MQRNVIKSTVVNNRLTCRYTLSIDVEERIHSNSEEHSLRLSNNDREFADIQPSIESFHLVICWSETHPTPFVPQQIDIIIKKKWFTNATHTHGKSLLGMINNRGPQMEPYETSQPISFDGGPNFINIDTLTSVVKKITKQWQYKSSDDVAFNFH